MRDTFQLIVMRCCLGGLFVLSVALVLSVFIPWLARKTTVAFRQWCRLGLVGMLLSGLFTTGMVLYGSIKAGGTNAAPSRTQRRLSPAAPQMERAENWYRRGAWDDGRVLSFADGWCFPHGTNHFESLELRAQGRLYATEKSEHPIVSLTTPLALAPYETEVRCGHTADNAYRIEWIDAHPNRASNQTADASIVLHRNGDIEITENGVTTNIVRELPFAHDGFGQDEAWVRANLARLQELSPSLTNAEQILSVGYTAWAEDQVGIGLTNGLYLFTASFPEDPPETTQLYIGDYTVAVTNAGDYTFVLGKGTDYEFGTWPHIENVDYYLQDDIGESAELITPYWWGGENPGEWTLDGGWTWFYNPSVFNGNYNPGYCCWMPTLQGAPAMTHLEPEDLPTTIEAVLSDVPEDCEVEYEWHADSECFDIESPTSPVTQIKSKAVPDWGSSSVSVTARFNGKSLTSSLAPITYGTNATSSVGIDLIFPSVIFLNDDNRADRIYELKAVIRSDVVTNGVLRLFHLGGDNPLVSTNVNMTGNALAHNYSFRTTRPGSVGTNTWYVAARDVKNGVFTLTCDLTGGKQLRSRRAYRVIEPLCKLVTTEQSSDGRYVNPSRLVYGTNAWLSVSVRGEFSPEEVQWAITTNNCRVVSRSGYKLKIEPTSSTGVATVIAKFNSDPHQPTFTLPIVTPRIIPVRAFIVNSSSGEMVTSVERVRKQISTANLIYEQVGIKFNLGSISRINGGEFWNLAEYDLTSAGMTNMTHISAKAVDLFNCYTNRDCVEVYYVSTITNSTAAAFAVQGKGIVMSSDGSEYSLAHELGHILGALDCYAKTKKAPSVTRWFSTILPRKGYFSKQMRDWGDAEGRGYYEKSDMYNGLVTKFLMNGFDKNQQADIPDGSVLSLRKNALSQSDRFMSPIGASCYEQKGVSEVLSK